MLKRRERHSRNSTPFRPVIPGAMRLRPLSSQSSVQHVPVRLRRRPLRLHAPRLPRRTSCPPGAASAPLRRSARFCARRPVAISAAWPRPAAGAARPAAPGPTAARPMSPEVSLADLPIDISSRADCRATSPRLQRHACCQPRLFGRPGGPRRPPVAFAAVAASALLGFWMFSAGGLIGFRPARRRRVTERGVGPDPGDRGDTSQGDLPEVLPSFTPPVLDMRASRPSCRRRNPSERRSRRWQSPRATVPSPQPEVPLATSGSATTPRPSAFDNRTREIARTAAAAAPARHDQSPRPFRLSRRPLSRRFGHQRHGGWRVRPAASRWLARSHLFRRTPPRRPAPRRATASPGCGVRRGRDERRA